jgi:hypothetical protein
VVLVKLINGELRAHLSKHPHRLEKREPRLFDAPIIDFLTTEDWTVYLTPDTVDGDSDLFAIARTIAVKPSAWMVEVKMYPSTNRAGMEIVGALYGITATMRTDGSMFATTSHFIGQGPARGDDGARTRRRRASHYSFELGVYDSILEWVNALRPHPKGRLMLREGNLTFAPNS